MSKGPRATGDHCAYLSRRCPERGRAFGGVEGRESAAGSRADVVKISAALERIHDDVDGADNMRQLAPDRPCHTPVLSIQGAQDAERGFSI